MRLVLKSVLNYSREKNPSLKKTLTKFSLDTHIYYQVDYQIKRDNTFHEKLEEYFRGSMFFLVSILLFLVSLIVKGRAEVR